MRLGGPLRVLRSHPRGRRFDQDPGGGGTVTTGLVQRPIGTRALAAPIRIACVRCRDQARLNPQARRQSCSGATSAVQLLLGDVGAGEVAPTKICVCQIGTAEIGSTQIHVRETGTVQVGAGKVGGQGALHQGAEREQHW